MATEGPQKAKTAANALLYAFAICAALIGLNIVGGRVFGRADLTEDKVYKLSQSSRDTVANLPDRLTVKAFISNGLQPPLNTYGQYIRDMLDEYAAASNGKLIWEAIDPTAPGKDDAETKANREEYKTKYKIKPITLERLSDSKLEIGSDNFLGVAFVYGENIESIPQIAATEGLEYRITGLIKKMTSAKRKKIGFAQLDGGLSTSQGLRYASQSMQDYDTTMVPLDKAIPDDIDCLIIAGPKQPIADKSKYYLDQFLMKGKPVGLFVDGMIIEQPRGMQMPGMDQPRIGRANDVNLQDLWEKWGVKVHEDLVLDDQNERGVVPVEGQMFLANYPTFVKVDDKGFSKGLSLTAHQPAIIMPFTSSVELTGDLKDGKVPGVTAKPVAMSSTGSWKQTGFFLFNPQVRLNPSPEKGPVPLGYAIEGKLKSAYPNGPGAADPNSSTPEGAATLKEAPDGTRLLVMGGSGILNDEMLPIQYDPNYKLNLLFFLNAVDWLVHDDSLINLRVKGMSERPLIIPPDSHAQLWRYICEIGIPIAVMLFGVVLWQLRSARRRSFHL
jgi:gliding-associated putative ABC transporter substrate-binding component GldG